MYFVMQWRDRPGDYQDAVDVCEALGSALKTAEERAEETGFDHVVFEDGLVVCPPSVDPLEDEGFALSQEEFNGVRPGVDFPVTLTPHRGII